MILSINKFTSTHVQICALHRISGFHNMDFQNMFISVNLRLKWLAVNFCPESSLMGAMPFLYLAIWSYNVYEEAVVKEKT